MEQTVLKKFLRKHIREEIAKAGSPKEVLVSAVDLIAPFRTLPPASDAKSKETILVNECGSHYELISGRKKLLFLKESGSRLCNVTVVSLSEEESCLFCLANYRSQNQKDILEMASAAKMLLEKYGIPLKDVVELTGQSRSQVLNAIRLLELPQSVLLAYAGGYITYGHARAMIGLSSGKAISIVQAIVEKKLSVREVELMMSSENGEADQEDEEGKLALLKKRSGASSVLLLKDNSILLNFDSPSDRDGFVEQYVGKGINKG